MCLFVWRMWPRPLISLACLIKAAEWIQTVPLEASNSIFSYKCLVGLCFSWVYLNNIHFLYLLLSFSSGCTFWSYISDTSLIYLNFDLGSLGHRAINSLSLRLGLIPSSFSPLQLLSRRASKHGPEYCSLVPSTRSSVALLALELSTMVLPDWSSEKESPGKEAQIQVDRRSGWWAVSFRGSLRLPGHGGLRWKRHPW